MGSLVLLLSSASLLQAQKTDTIALRNGDRVTGEIIELKRGRLTVDTDQAGGKVRIRWKNIASLSSKKLFEISLSSGELLLGSFQPGATDSLLDVTVSDSLLTLNRFSVVYIKPVKEGFWSRWEGSLSAGLTFLQAAEQTDYNLNWESRYRVPTRDFVLNASSFFRTRQEGSNTYKNSLRALYLRKFSRKRFVFGLSGVQQNSDLDLDYRTVVGAGTGRTLFSNHEMTIDIAGGAAYTLESFPEIEDTEESLEGIILFNLAAYIFGALDTELGVEIVLIPSITNGGRMRIHSNVDMRREVFDDFFIEASYLNDYDNEPPDPESRRNDATVTFSIGWSFQ